METKIIKGNKAYLINNNIEVKKVLHNCQMSALENGYDHILYEDEKGSCAYCVKSTYGMFPNQTEENKIATILVIY